MDMSLNINAISSSKLFLTSLVSLATGVAVAALYFQTISSNPKKEVSLPDKMENEVHVVKSALGTQHSSAHADDYRGCIYLDYNATTCIFPEVTNAMLPFLSNCFGNPSSGHIYAEPCKKALDMARERIGALINAPTSNTIYFTSCGSESDNRAIDIAIHHYKQRYFQVEEKSIVHVITSAVEHPAILSYLKHLVDMDAIEVTIIPADTEGFIDMNVLTRSLRTSTALVTIMHSNNEVGTIQPIQRIASAIKRFNNEHRCDILLHVDGAQSLGKVRVDVMYEGIDMLSIVGHKYGAPKGVAALYMRDGIKTCPMLIGGGQERGLRAGTENVLLVVGLGVASHIALQEADDLLIHMLTLKLQLMKSLIVGLESISSILISSPRLFRFNGPKKGTDIESLTSCMKMISSIKKTALSSRFNEQRSLYGSAGLSAMVDQLPNTVSISFKDIKASDLLHRLYDKVACSAGSACHTSDADEKISSVLLAMKVPIEYAGGTLRLSLGRHTTHQEIDLAAKHIIEAVKDALR